MITYLYDYLQLYYKEPWTITPLILPILFGVLWILALKYYFSNVSDWQASEYQQPLYKHAEVDVLSV